jgi:UDP-glucose 4-epimerase
MQMITGGLGFIGNELARHMLSDEDLVILDNRHRVAPRIEDLAKIPVRQVDLVDQERVRMVLDEVRPKIVYHLGAIYFAPECNADPERTLRVNVEATMTLLRACKAVEVEHVLFASSGAVYADSPRELSELSLIEPIDIYGWSKWFAEEICRWFSAREGMRITVCRLFNNFGPRETNAHIIPEIIHQLRHGDRLKLGNTTARRDYIHVSDTAQALRRLSESTHRGHRTVNVGGGQHASVDEIIQMIAGILKRKLEVVHVPDRFRSADKQVQIADITLFHQLTGWKPSTTIRDGLESLLRFEGLLK